MANTSTIPGLRDTCFFCEGADGQCACHFPGEENTNDPTLGFEFEDIHITSPNVSPCGRFYVDPEVYYGDAYLNFVARGLPPGWPAKRQPATEQTKPRPRMEQVRERELAYAKAIPEKDFIVARAMLFALDVAGLPLREGRSGEIDRVASIMATWAGMRTADGQYAYSAAIGRHLLDCDLLVRPGTEASHG